MAKRRKPGSDYKEMSEEIFRASQRLDEPSKLMMLRMFSAMIELAEDDKIQGLHVETIPNEDDPEAVGERMGYLAIWWEGYDRTFGE